MSRGDPVQASITCTVSIALATLMYVRDSKHQGLRVRYADDTFFFSARLLSDHIVNRCSPWPRAEGKVHFILFL